MRVGDVFKALRFLNNKSVLEHFYSLQMINPPYAFAKLVHAGLFPLVPNPIAIEEVCVLETGFSTIPYMQGWRECNLYSHGN